MRFLFPNSRGKLLQDDEAVVGVKEDTLALAVVLIGFSIFVASIFSSMLWVEESRKTNEFHDDAPRIADEIVLLPNLRAPNAEPGILSLQAIERMANELSDLESEASSEFIRDHGLEEIGYLVVIETIQIEETTTGGEVTFTAGLTEQHTFQWSSVNPDSIDAELSAAQQVLSIRRPVNIIDENMPERVAPGFVQVVIWR
jgi:hypothetical protein